MRENKISKVNFVFPASSILVHNKLSRGTKDVLVDSPVHLFIQRITVEDWINWWEQEMFPFSYCEGPAPISTTFQTG